MRKQKRIEIQDGERTLTFLIEEMPATRLERFIVKAALLACGSGAVGALIGAAKTPSGATATAGETAADDPREGLKQLAEERDANAILVRLGSIFQSGNFALLGDVDPDKLDDLLNDLLKCCTYVDGNTSFKLGMDNVDTVVETLPALFALQKEAAALNFGFLAQGARLRPDNGETPRARDTASNPRISVRSNRL